MINENKLITRAEVNALVENTFQDDLNKIVTYGEVSGSDNFQVYADSRIISGMTYTANQGLLSGDIEPADAHITLNYLGGVLPAIAGETTAFTVDIKNVPIVSCGVDDAGATVVYDGNTNILTLTYPDNTDTQIGKTYRITMSGTDIYERPQSDYCDVQQAVGAEIVFNVIFTGATPLSPAAGSTSDFSINLANATITGVSVNDAAASVNYVSGVITLTYPANLDHANQKTYTITVSGEDIYGRAVTTSVNVTVDADSYALNASATVTGITFADTGVNYSLSSTNISSIGYDSSQSQYVTGFVLSGGDVWTASVNRNGSDEEREIVLVVTGLTRAGQTVFATGDTVTQGYAEGVTFASNNYTDNTPTRAAGDGNVVLTSKVATGSKIGYYYITGDTGGNVGELEQVTASTSPYKFPITLPVNGYVKIIRMDNNPEYTSNITGLTVSANIGYDVSGNLENLLRYTGNLPNSAFTGTFSGDTNLRHTSGLTLPSTVLSNKCYDSMFAGCTGLTDVPEISGSTLAEACYKGMFADCKSLTTPPDLPVETLAVSCYENMFSGCTSLSTTPLLPATALTKSCYNSMFRNCTSLTTANTISGEEMGEMSCRYMFVGCTGLTDAPELNIVTTANMCCEYMFSGCTSLTGITDLVLSAADTSTACYRYMFSRCTSLQTLLYNMLPATGITASCYEGMFFGCTSLTGANGRTPDLLADIPVGAASAYTYMFSGCTALVHACSSAGPDGSLPSTTLSQSCYKGMFAGCYSLISDDLPVLPATAMTKNCYQYMFYDCRNRGFTRTPELPATSLAESCYEGMFMKCIFLESSNLPQLKATTLARNCYRAMFSDCSTITGATELGLSSTALAEGCYAYMFSGCTSLADNGLPILSASTLRNGCYEGMFDGCRSLTKTPDLSSATTLANSCYKNMFRDCVNLNSSKITTLPVTQIFYHCYDAMFRGCTGTAFTHAPEIPATTLAEGCYQEMFRGCENLIGMYHNGTASGTIILPAGALASYCYSGMFQDCIALTTSPSLNASQLTNNCYSHMFQGCTGLTTTPSLASTTLGYSCYECMFADCTSLTTTTDLSATTLAENCYKAMFSGCTSLTTTTDLSATTLAGGCYEQMYRGCTSLTTTTDLSATTLAENCYKAMFSGCTSLETTPEILATSMALSACTSMFAHCTSLTSATDLSATTLAAGCYAYMFLGCTGLTTGATLYSEEAVTNCYLGMFSGCTLLNTIICYINQLGQLYSENWVVGVPGNGIFYKKGHLTPVFSRHNIPVDYNNKWTVKDVSEL